MQVLLPRWSLKSCSHGDVTGCPHDSPGAQQPPSKQSAKGKPKWIYFAGAGVAAVLVVGVIAIVAAFVIFSGSKKTTQPVRPAALTDQQPKPTQPADGTQQSAPPSQSAPDQTTVGTQQPPDTNVIPVQQQPTVTAPAVATEAPAQSGSRQATRTSAQPRQQPQQPAKSNNQKSAHQRALEALDQ